MTTKFQINTHIIGKQNKNPDTQFSDQVEGYKVFEFRQYWLQKCAFTKMRAQNWRSIVYESISFAHEMQKI